MAARRKVLVIGIDCATPQLVFDRLADRLPNITKLRSEGVWGSLESTTPAITVPAWTAMLSGRDPGELGFYGFRNRADHTYTGLTIATSLAIRHDRVWDVLSRAGKKSIVHGVPQTFPPKPLEGCMITSFLTPDTDSDFTWPPELKKEVMDLVDGSYPLDVEDFRTDDKQRLIEATWEMTEKQYKVFAHLLKTREWDFAINVQMGVDRLHHGFWKYFDPAHRAYEPGSPFENTIGDYYALLDRKVGELVELAGPDATVIVVSDHGAQALDGCICVNEWLRQKGYLALKEEPAKGSKLKPAMIDWSHTKAWGEGGYYARLFMNVAGREPEGTIPAAQYEAVRSDLIRELEAIVDEDGRNIGTVVYRPEDVYREVNGVPPDLMVYFGDLRWRSVGTVGHGTFITHENDTGPDDANHARHGIFAMCRPGDTAQGKRLEGLRIYQVCATILKELGIAPPADIPGPVGS